MGKGNGANGGGGKGDDVLHDGDGQTILRGGRGDDSYYIDTEGVVVAEKNNGGNDTVFSWVNYSLDAHVENTILQGDADLAVSGNELSNVIVGNDGANDLFGGAGDDFLGGGIGNDLLDGGEGIDTAVLDGSAADFSFQWVDDTLIVTSANGETDTIRNIEFLEFYDQTIAIEDIADTEEPVQPISAVQDNVTGNEDESIVIDVLANDSGAGLVIESAADGAIGTVVVNADNTLTYTPAPDASGTDTITYVIVDQYGETAEASVSITIDPVNDSPTAGDDFFATTSDETLISQSSVLANDEDPDGDLLTVVSFDGVTANGGAVSMSADGTFSYTSADGFTGTDSFTYVASDGNGGTQTANVEITVDAPPPLATADTADATEDAALIIDVLANDTGTGLTIQSVEDGTRGTVTINPDNTLTYTPALNDSGNDTFSYTAVDAAGQESTAVVSVSIAPENDVPVAVDDFYIISEGGAFNSPDSLLDNDEDVDGDQLTVVAHDQTSQNGGTVHVHSDGTYSYTAPAGFVGTDSFTYTAGDGNGGEHSATVELQVEAVDTPEPSPDPEPDVDYIDALMAGDWYRLNANEDYGSAATVTFAFATETPDYYSETSVMRDNFQAFNEAQQANTRAALEDVANFANLNFVETSVEEAEIVFGIADVGSAGFAYWPTYNGIGKTASDVWIDDSLAANDFAPGSSSYTTLVHEVGHALGLTHPELLPEEENHAFTVMADPQHPGMEGAEATTFMVYDIATLQYMYGANDQYAAGDDVYTFDDVREDIQTLWDGGGHDILDMSAAEYGVQIDLNAGTHSTVASNGEGNLAIAIGAEIEDAIGSVYDDVLASNDLNNNLTGGDGVDTFTFSGAWGQDTVTDFVSGEDILQISTPELTFSDLQMSISEGGLMITAGAESIFLANQVEELDEAEILFL